MAVTRPQSAGRTRATQKRPRVHWALKLASILGAFLTAVLGVQTIFQGVQAGNDPKLQKLLTQMEAQSYGAWDIYQAGTMLVVTVILAALSSTCGCVGAMADQQCALAVFGIGALGLGFVVLTLCACMGVYLRSQAPMVSKALNRICQQEIGAPHALKTGLASQCTTAMTTATRRLESQDATILPSLTSFLPRSAMLMSALSAELLGAPEVLNGTARRLLPGTAEESIVLRTCSRLGPALCPDPCTLIDQLCIEPDGFDLLTACICDRQGPRAHQLGNLQLIPARCPQNDQSPMCETDGSSPPHKQGVYCMSPKPNLGPADLMTELVGGFEACFVLPSADCSSRGGTVPADCTAAGDQPCISAGPCIDPDSRSKLFVESRAAALKFVQLAAVLGSFACIAATFALCMCCQIHTGASVLDHAVRLTQPRPRRAGKAGTEREGLVQSDAEESEDDEESSDVES